MSDMIFFIIGTVVLAIAVIIAIHERHDTKKWTSTVLLGILFTTMLYIIPTVKITESSGGFYDALYRIMYALMYAHKTLSTRQTISEIYNIVGIWRDLFLLISYAMFFTAPLLSTALIVSFFGDMGEKIRYALHFSKECYIFSDLNSNALSIAKGIKKNKKSVTLVFCNSKSADEKLKIKAKKLGGICFFKPCTEFKVGFLHKYYEFYVVSQNEDNNVSMTERIIAKNKTVKNDKITISAFAQSGTSVEIIEKIDQDNIRIRFVDQSALLCNQIIFSHPLYDLPDDRRDISVLIAGCGNTGMQMLKTVAWCGQIDGYTLKIRVYDSKASKIEAEFYSGAPEMKSDEYDIKFIDADIIAADFEDKITDSLDATFVFIATGDDELNLKSAARLRGILRRKTGTFSLQPKILTRVRDDFKTANINQSKYLTDRNIIAFGNAAELFESKLPFETRFERLSLGVHLVYYGALDADTGSDEYKNACREFYSQEYDRRSSMATALHIAAKLRAVGVIKPNQYELTNEIADKFEQLIKDNDELIISLAKNEHIRWNAFFRSEGYRSTDFETVKKYCRYMGDNHKDPLSKLHPCITDWDNLDPLETAYNAYIETLPKNPDDEKEKKTKKANFKKYDIKIVECIPQIIRFANKQ